VHPHARGRGTGRRLLEILIASTEAAGIWTIQSGIFSENTASVALHQAVGFRVIGTRKHIGQHHRRWRDVLFIERRSAAIWLAGLARTQTPGVSDRLGKAKRRWFFAAVRNKCAADDASGSVRFPTDLRSRFALDRAERYELIHQDHITECLP
jgi:hypothetical protein